jgi:hydroxymethylglutaryl-CoA lyase
MNDDQVCITDVGPRDGLQNQPQHIATAGKVALIKALAQAGLRSIEATSFVSPKAVPQMADAAEVMAAVSELSEVDMSVLVPNTKGLERAVAAGSRCVAMVLAATETMNRRNINMSLEQALAESLRVIDAARGRSLRVRAYLAVAFECPFEGRVSVEATLRLARSLAAAGADEIVVADTIGAAAPADITAVIGALAAEMPVNTLALHLHDTRGMAVANAWAGLQAGVRRFDASLGGIGGCPFAPGASGNMATEDLALLCRQSGYKTGIDLGRLMDAIQFAESLLGRPLGRGSAAWLRSGVAS